MLPFHGPGKQSCLLSREALYWSSRSVNVSLFSIADAMNGDEGVVEVIQEEELGQLCLNEEITG